LKVGFTINNKIQDCKVGTERGILVGGGMKEMRVREYGRLASDTYWK
jgi:hypothetical protein